MHIFFVVLLFIFIRSSDAQIVQSGQCPKVETVTDFTPTEHLGVWYETKKYPIIFEPTRKCMSLLITAEPDNTGGIQLKLTSGEAGIDFVSTATGIPDGDGKDGKWNVTFESALNSEPYWILGTDYDSYSVVWTCTEIFVRKDVNINFRNAYILTRERNPPETVITKAIEVMEKNKIETRYLTEVDQKGC